MNYNDLNQRQQKVVQQLILENPSFYDKPVVTHKDVVLAWQASTAKKKMGFPKFLMYKNNSIGNGKYIFPTPNLQAYKDAFKEKYSESFLNILEKHGILPRC